jgi:hypothetical protein
MAAAPAVGTGVLGASDMLNSVKAGLGSPGDFDFLVRSRGFGPFPSLEALRASPIAAAVAVPAAAPVAAPGVSASGVVVAMIFPAWLTPSTIGGPAAFTASIDSAGLSNGLTPFWPLLIAGLSQALWGVNLPTDWDAVVAGDIDDMPMPVLRLAERFGWNWVTGRRLRRGAVEAVLTLRTLGTLLANASTSENFSSSKGSRPAIFLRRLKQKMSRDAITPTSRMVPRAMPALAPTDTSLEPELELEFGLGLGLISWEAGKAVGEAAEVEDRAGLLVGVDATTIRVLGIDADCEEMLSGSVEPCTEVWATVGMWLGVDAATVWGVTLAGVGLRMSVGATTRVLMPPVGPSNVAGIVV